MDSDTLLEKLKTIFSRAHIVYNHKICMIRALSKKE